MNDSKSCNKCKKTLPLAEFYAERSGADGYRRHCKDCHRQAMTARRSANPEFYREQSRNRKKSPESMVRERDRLRRRRQLFPEKTKEYLRRHAEKCPPEKRTAWRKVNNAVRSGRLMPEPCETCGSMTAHAHHEDYSKPLDVKWLCPQHHADRHKELRAMGVQL